MGSSAKGVLLVPEEAISDDFDLDDIASEWSKFKGVIKLKMKKGIETPKQISANAKNIGAHDMLALQLKFMQDIFGSSPAIQGQRAPSGTPSSLYAQEAQNSTLNSKDLIDHFSWYIESRDQKILKLMLQFYKEERYINIGGTSYSEEAKIFRPELVEDVDIDLKIIQGQDTPIYRQLIDDLLFKLLEGNFIPINTFLENTSLPFADKIIESMQQQQQQIQEQGGLQPGQDQIQDPLIQQLATGVQNERPIQ